MHRDPTICLLHGYLLEGSGSNLWTRAMAQALCRTGHGLHLVCQEAHPEAYDFIAAARIYGPDGAVTTLFERETPYPARCVLHKPILGDTLPVYVPDHYDEFTRVVPMVELPDAEVEHYLDRNVAVVERVVREHRIASLHANHAVLMSVVAERVGAATGIPFAVMPHGSAIEYAVKKDLRFHALAAHAFDRASHVFVHGPEMRQRVIETFPDRPSLASKIVTLNLGVDTAAFAPVDREQRAETIAALTDALRGLDRAMPGDAGTRLCERLHGEIDQQDLAALLAEAQNQTGKLPDARIEGTLGRMDWERDDVLLFVGRLISAKGLHCLIAALPRILAARPRARLIVVGDGPLRAVMEAFLWALQHGEIALARNIVNWGPELEGGLARPYEELRAYFDALEAQGEIADYFETARRTVRPDRVIFTGYLTHAELKHLMPCCDVAVFPSLVAEAGPLVLLEALAAGCFPLGTYFAGMAAHIDSVADVLPLEDAALMRLHNAPARVVADIVANAPSALALAGRHKWALRGAVVDRYDWTSAAEKLATELAESSR